MIYSLDKSQKVRYLNSIFMIIFFLLSFFRRHRAYFPVFSIAAISNLFLFHCYLLIFVMRSCFAQEKSAIADELYATVTSIFFLLIFTKFYPKKNKDEEKMVGIWFLSTGFQEIDRGNEGESVNLKMHVV